MGVLNFIRRLSKANDFIAIANKILVKSYTVKDIEHKVILAIKEKQAPAINMSVVFKRFGI